jgi:hypothetical protein
VNSAELTTRESADEEPAPAQEEPTPVRTPVENVLSLQRTGGNASVARLLGGGTGRTQTMRRTPNEDDRLVTRSLARAAAQRGTKEPDPAPEADVVPADLEEEGDEFDETEGDEIETEETPQAASAARRSLARNGGKTKAPVTPKIKSKTKLKAPNGSSDRTTIAVGEQVTFTGNAAGDWNADGGTPLNTPAAKKTFKWRAPDRAATVNITFIIGAKQATRTMTVIGPTHLTGKKVKKLNPFPAGMAGAGMELRFTYHPLTVSFGNIEVKEVSGPATNLSGYFPHASSSNGHFHNSGDTFFRVGQNNKDSAVDTASFRASGYPPPFSDGGFDWVIPNHFRTIFEGDTDGQHFTDVTQSFRIEGPPHAGRATVSKAGESETRSP